MFADPRRTSSFSLRFLDLRPQELSSLLESLPFQAWRVRERAAGSVAMLDLVPEMDLTQIAAFLNLAIIDSSRVSLWIGVVTSSYCSGVSVPDYVLNLVRSAKIRIDFSFVAVGSDSGPNFEDSVTVSSQEKLIRMTSEDATRTERFFLRFGGLSQEAVDALRSSQPPGLLEVHHVDGSIVVILNMSSRLDYGSLYLFIETWQVRPADCRVWVSVVTRSDHSGVALPTRVLEFIYMTKAGLDLAFLSLESDDPVAETAEADRGMLLVEPQ